MRNGCAVVLGLLFCGCALDSEPPADEVGPTGQLEEPIINGTEDPGHDPAVGLLLAVDSNGNWLTGCTATMITRRVAITAAHCVADQVAGQVGTKLKFVDEFNYGTNVDTGVVEPPKTVVNKWVDPDFNINAGVGLGAHDLALLLMDNPLSASIMPAQFYRSRLTSKIIGTANRFVGYGIRSDANTESFFIRQTASANISSLDNQQFGWTTAISHTCLGDSGGPNFIMVNGVEYTIGVTSETLGSTCAGRSDQQRLDVSLQAILDFIAAHDPQATSNCGADGICGWNCPDIDPDCPCALDGRCEAACPDLDTDPDCPTSCEDDGVCQRTGCPRPDPDCGSAVTGATCTTNNNCASELCVASGSDHVCTQSCDASGVCPAGFSCKTTTKVCMPETGDGGGCAVAGGGSGLGLGLALVGLGLAWMRRHRRRALQSAA